MIVFEHNRRKKKMNITQLEKEIINALNINSNVDWDSNETSPNMEFKELIKFVKKCFKEHKGVE